MQGRHTGASNPRALMAQELSYSLQRPGTDGTAQHADGIHLSTQQSCSPWFLHVVSCFAPSLKGR